MSDIISPHFLGKKSVVPALAYQRLMLAQMGITPWVSPTTPVQSFDIKAIFTNTEVVNAQKFSQTIEIYQNNASWTSHNLTLENTVAQGQPPVVETVTSQGNISQISPVIEENTSQLTCRYHIQAMTLPNWLFIADNDILQQDNQQFELWQKIGQSMDATFYQLQFPLVNQPHRQLLSGHKNDPNTLTHLFANETLGMATFSGFVHSLVGGNRQVGYLTPLPDILLTYPMQALPTLSAMLDDPQQKKTLWQLMQPAQD